MKKSVFRQKYYGDGEVTVIKDKVEAVKEEKPVKEEKKVIKKKGVK